MKEILTKTVLYILVFFYGDGDITIATQHSITKADIFSFSISVTLTLQNYLRTTMHDFKQISESKLSKFGILNTLMMPLDNKEIPIILKVKN